MINKVVSMRENLARYTTSVANASKNLQQIKPKKERGSRSI